MSTNRTDRLLGEWSTVARTATPPVAPNQVEERRRGGSPISVVGAGLLALVLVVAIAWLGNREGPAGSGSGGTPASTVAPTIVPPTPTPSASPAPAVAATPTPRPSPTATPRPTATPGPIDCTLDDLVARITRWEGAAGHRIADVEVTNAGAGPCILPTLARPQLVDGNGGVLIDGTSTSGSSLTLKPGGTATTLVDAANYCGPTPVAPVSVAFVMGGPDLRLIAAPVSRTDTTVPPCNGPGQPGSIDMHPWAP